MSTTNMELVPSPASRAVTKIDRDDSLIGWLIAYANAEVAESPATTIDAKRRDLQLFLNFFGRRYRSDHIDDWTKSVTKGFCTWLEKEKGDAATTVNRRLATLRHFCRWVSKRREFLAGDPFDGIVDLDTDEPPALGLTDLEENRLRAAADKLLVLKKRKHQLPRRDYAIFLVLLRTAMRVSELVNLDLDQYQGKHFLNVKRKGRKRSSKVYIAQEARDALDAYLDRERGREAGPLFRTRTGKPVARQTIDVMLRELADLANVNLPEEEKIHLHAHLLRHTALKDMMKKGRHYAQKMSGNVGPQHLDRYTNPLDEDYEAAVEEASR